MRVDAVQTQVEPASRPSRASPACGSRTCPAGPRARQVAPAGRARRRLRLPRLSVRRARHRGVEAIGATGPAASWVIPAVRGARRRLLNGVLVHGLDFDDTHLASIIHPSTTSLPVALSLSESIGRAGRSSWRPSWPGRDRHPHRRGRAGRLPHVGYHARASSRISHRRSRRDGCGLNEDQLVSAQGSRQYGSASSLPGGGRLDQAAASGWGAVRASRRRLAQNDSWGPAAPTRASSALPHPPARRMEHVTWRRPAPGRGLALRRDGAEPYPLPLHPRLRRRRHRAARRCPDESFPCARSCRSRRCTSSPSRRRPRNVPPRIRGQVQRPVRRRHLLGQGPRRAAGTAAEAFKDRSHGAHRQGQMRGRPAEPVSDLFSAASSDAEGWPVLSRHVPVNSGRASGR